MICNHLIIRAIIYGIGNYHVSMRLEARAPANLQVTPGLKTGKPCGRVGRPVYFRAGFGLAGIVPGCLYLGSTFWFQVVQFAGHLL